MLWRDGDEMWHWEYDDCQGRRVLLPNGDIENEFEQWLSSDAEQMKHLCPPQVIAIFHSLYRSEFLLDYIEYLFESVIDEQLVEEELDRQCVKKIDWTVWNHEHLCRIFTYA